MYIIECNNCGEHNQTHDKMKRAKLRCICCNNVIQIGPARSEVVRNINTIDDHEIRIQGLESRYREIRITDTIPNSISLISPIIDYSLNGFISSIHKCLHHWFIFYITITIIAMSIFIPLGILSLIGT